MRRIKINKNKLSEYMKYPVGYGSVSVMVPYPMNPREGVCDACQRSKSKGEINKTALHHWKYAYQHKTIKKDPLLALDNLSELCFICHTDADGFRQLLEKERKGREWMLLRTALLMPSDMKERLDKFCKAYLNARKNDKKTKLEEYFEDDE